jgi:isoaspartyl peptidase/L-asparaginase-like protein (Ntn-hydrolase superfamily)
MALVRYRPDGTVAASLTADVSGFSDFGHALAIDAQGRIVAAGSAGGQLGLLRANL